MVLKLFSFLFLSGPKLIPAQSHLIIGPMGKFGNEIGRRMRREPAARGHLSFADARSQRINCRNNCRHEESFKPASRDIVWRGYSRLPERACLRTRGT